MIDQKLSGILSRGLSITGASLSGHPDDHFDQFATQEGFRWDQNPPNAEQAQLTRGRQLFVRDLGTKTRKGEAVKRGPQGEITNGDGYHEFVVHRDLSVPEGHPEAAARSSKKPRYELSYHHVDRNGRLNAQSLWFGNTARGLNAAHEKFKGLMAGVK